MTRYPTPDEYTKAVQRPDSFTSDELRGLRLVAHPRYGIPMPAAGTSAVVFKAVGDGEPEALRFFTRDDVWSGERYDALRDHFTGRGLADAVALPRWVDDGIRVNGRTWPVVRMQWVEGHPLNRHVEGLVERVDTAALDGLARSWRELVGRLQRAGFAHGDLQHGNVLVDPAGGMRLVDFDCAWIAPFAGTAAPSETGHRNYQPPTRPWGPWMDTFSALVIYLSLVALARAPAAWRTLHTGENLLFRHEDFRAPFDTPAWAHLASLGDARVDELAGRLRECCAPGWVAGTSLDDLLAPRAVPWWERTRVPVPAAPAAPTPAAPGPVAPGPDVPAARPEPVAPRREPRRAVHPTTGPWWQAVEPAPERRGALAVVLWSVLVGLVSVGAFLLSEVPVVTAVAAGGSLVLVVLVVGLVRRSRSG